MTSLNDPTVPMHEPRRISYTTDDPVAGYNQTLDAATDPADLRRRLGEWPTLAPDAREAAKGITAEDWPEWRRGLESERRGKFAGETWAARFSVITTPARMLRASIVADQFMVPWGLAWLRLKEAGKLDG